MVNEISISEKNIENGGEKVYNEVLEKILKLIDNSEDIKFIEVKNKSGSSIFDSNKIRLLKVVKTKSGYKIEFNVHVSSVEGMKILTDEEAKEKHMGTAKWIYSGNDFKVIEKLVLEAIENYKHMNISFKNKKKNDEKIEENEIKLVT
ncbi:hypothetical protein [Thermosipho sp. (in: thermotogales)]|jgi:hypothetical protein|uniref:hypothetical protein n=1 Tax=Thermosipho sp. (in: thermotogales) TaxID=1968895 RepID=UPI00257E1DD5|nr:hypothetical protein [Thermosipho sp. (in: thermotogales)]MBZ4649238.1 hypothetical protein [Thermosipho sp. (in: thermotogales)]